jgi:hypothetical protein
MRPPSPCSTIKMGIKAKRLKAGWDAAYLRKILDQ